MPKVGGDPSPHSFLFCLNDAFKASTSSRPARRASASHNQISRFLHLPDKGR